MQKFFLLHLGFMILAYSAFAQFPGPFTWSAGDAIGGVGPAGNNDPIGRQTIPRSNNLLAKPLSTIDFSIRFTDFDQAVCSNGNVVRTTYTGNVNYVVRFRSSSPKARFQNGQIDFVTANLGHSIFTNPFHPTLTNEYIFIYENASLTIDDTWLPGEVITVTVEITDNADLPVGSHRGDPRDPTIVFNTWTITHSANCPSSLAKVYPNPTDATWTPLPGGASQYIDFTYQGLPSQAPAYANQVIREVFDMPGATEIFTMDDLNPTWLAAHPNVMVADDAVREIFVIQSTANSFIFDNQNRFIDSHNGALLQLMPGNLWSTYFKDEAVGNSKVGYRIRQRFICNPPAPIAITYIYRRRNGISGDVELRKTH